MTEQHEKEIEDKEQEIEALCAAGAHGVEVQQAIEELEKLKGKS